MGADMDIRIHEEAPRHQGNLARTMKESRIRGKEKEREKGEVDEELARIERAALAAMGADMEEPSRKRAAEEEEEAESAKRARSEVTDTDGRVLHTDPITGQKYWYDTATRTSEWAASQGLPTGWAEAKDPGS